MHSFLTMWGKGIEVDEYRNGVRHCHTSSASCNCFISGMIRLPYILIRLKITFNLMLTCRTLIQISLW